NMQDIFEQEVVDYFTAQYLQGRTPNPCVKCNDVLKFQALRSKAEALGAGYLATGHYARIEYINGSPRLFKGVDKTKDQSYFLFTMTEAQLRGTLFPLGSMTKAEVRGKARELGLRTSEKEESQEICFVEGGSYSDFIVSRSEGAAKAGGGNITDRAGNVLGTHEGLFKYTIGQRKGLGIGGGDGPFYVSGIDTMNNRLVVGPVEELYSRGLRAGDITLTGGGDAASTLTAPGLKARIRYGFGEVPCRVSLTPDKGLIVEFERPQKSVTPGQAVVFYRGDEVIGGGWIEEALS
ncbi:MAG: tRNA 2-thiouridine(34) synthase MnmA, partial [Thermodesulfobacteriota bacterium]